MNQETLLSPEIKNQTLKLIDGKFSKREALHIINNVMDVKINFHKLQRLSKTEGNINDVCEYDTTRISELIRDKKEIMEFLKNLEGNGHNLKIKSTISISIDE